MHLMQDKPISFKFAACVIMTNFSLLKTTPKAVYPGIRCEIYPFPYSRIFCLELSSDPERKFYAKYYCI